MYSVYLSFFSICDENNPKIKKIGQIKKISQLQCVGFPFGNGPPFVSLNDCARGPSQSYHSYH